MDSQNFATFKEMFPLPEIHVCRTLGLNRDEVRRLRGNLLKKGTDWELVKNRVCYSHEALAKVRGNLGVSPAVSGEKTQDGANAEAPQPVQEELTEIVTLRTRNENKRILVGHFSADGPEPKNWVHIRVRDNTRYRPGMRLQCRHVQGKVYVHVGRIPRTPIV